MAGMIENHERCLTSLIKNNFKPIYMGDTVRVSERWAPQESKNPDEGKEGVVIMMERGIQGVFNADYIVYHIRPQEGKSFSAYHYTLDLVYQTSQNKLIEKLLREKLVKEK